MQAADEWKKELEQLGESVSELKKWIDHHGWRAPIISGGYWPSLEGLAIAQSQDLGNFDSLIMHCVDLANALDGARMIELSNFATELSQQLKVHRPTSSQTELDGKNGKELVLLINDLVEIVRAGDRERITWIGRSGWRVKHSRPDPTRDPEKRVLETITTL